MPRLLPAAAMSRASCKPSSRVGTTTSAWGRPSAPSLGASTRSSSGRPKPSVLPVPVGAWPIRSVPRRAIGTAYSWIANALVIPAAASASTVSARTPNSAKVGLSGRTGARVSTGTRACSVSLFSMSVMKFYGCLSWCARRSPGRGMGRARATREKRLAGRTRVAAAERRHEPTSARQVNSTRQHDYAPQRGRRAHGGRAARNPGRPGVVVCLAGGEAERPVGRLGDLHICHLGDRNDHPAALLIRKRQHVVLGHRLGNGLLDLRRGLSALQRQLARRVLHADLDLHGVLPFLRLPK